MLYVGGVNHAMDPEPLQPHRLAGASKAYAQRDRRALASCAADLGLRQLVAVGPTCDLADDDRRANSAAVARRAFFLDPDMIAWGTLRPISEKDTSPTGDSEKGVILGEGCLKVRNEAGLGVIADLYGLTSGT